jgi:hypothetical protein
MDQRTQEILEDNGSTFEPEYKTDAEIDALFSWLKNDPAQIVRKVAGDAARARQLLKTAPAGKFRVIGTEFPDMDKLILVGDFDALADARKKAAVWNAYKNTTAGVFDDHGKRCTKAEIEFGPQGEAIIN